VHDYITAATYDDMGYAIENFTLESEKISYVLRTFDCYRLDQIDYCINFSVDELASGCSLEQIMTLIRRGDIPRHYTEWQGYSSTSHRKKSSPDSFYLVNKSLGINCYRKLAEMEKRSEQREQYGLSMIPQSVLDTAKNIIRFEVQGKYRKTYIQSRKARDSGNFGQNKSENLLDDLSCLGINPVIIPKGWGMKRIPNILYAYFDKKMKRI